jgi:hypothetical protein
MKQVSSLMQDGWNPIGKFGVNYYQGYMYFKQILVRDPQHSIKRPNADFKLICVYAISDPNAGTTLQKQIEYYMGNGYVPVGKTSTGQYDGHLIYFQGMKR